MVNLNSFLFFSMEKLASELMELLDGETEKVSIEKVLALCNRSVMKLNCLGQRNRGGFSLAEPQW